MHHCPWRIPRTPVMPASTRQGIRVSTPVAVACASLAPGMSASAADKKGTIALHSLMSAHAFPASKQASIAVATDRMQQGATGL